MILCHILIMLVSVQSVITYRAKRERKEKKCEEVRAEICLKEVHTGYNSTSFPNHLSHRTQDEAIMELNTYTSLIKIRCSKHLATFLCSLYVPLCTPGFFVLPCKELCVHARQGCKPVMDNFGYNWNFNCSKYPDGNESNMCLGANARKKGIIPKEENKGKVEPKDKTKPRKGWISGKENETLHLSCNDSKSIYIRKVRTSAASNCCPTASMAVISAMCTGNASCKVFVSKTVLGGHCKGIVKKLAIRYKCIYQIKKGPCSD